MKPHTRKLRARQDYKEFTETKAEQTFGSLNAQQRTQFLTQFYVEEIHNPQNTLISEDDFDRGCVDSSGDRLRLAGESVEITILYLYFWRESAINLAWPMNARIPSTTRGPNGSATTTKRSRGCRRSRRARPGNGIRCSVSTISCEVSMIGCNVRTIG